MIKNLLLSISALAMVVTPIAASAQDRHRHYERSERHERRDRGNGCGWLCGAIIGGIVVGALSSNDRDSRRNPDFDRHRDFDNRYYPPDYRYDRRYCVREQITEWRRGERYVYWQTTCN